jgi:endoglucanase
MKKQNLIQIVIIATLLFNACNHNGGNKEEVAEKILFNQVGYISTAQKMALVADDVDEVIIINSDGEEIMQITPGEPMFWDKSGDAVRKIDFSTLSEPGNYTIILPQFGVGAEIVIDNRPFEALTKAALRSFYFNRTAMPIEEQYGGIWARPAGHPDTIVYIHASATDQLRPEGTIISSPLGWYDAGDYNKYVVNSGITTFTLLQALEDFPEYYASLDINIPESGSGIPDILSEILYNLRWVLTMQDPNDGGVYHKLTTKQFEAFVMPHEATNKRYVVDKGTAATLNFAALAAKSYRVLQSHETLLPNLADSCLQKAELAWNWALLHPNSEYIQPEDIVTGGYGDKNFNDEWFWAAAELYLATKNQMYLDVLLEKYSKPIVPSWNQVNTLGFMSLLNKYEELPPSIHELGLKGDFLELTDKLTELSQIAPYGVSIQNFQWGSNSQVANEGMLKLFGYRLNGNSEYLTSALSDLDYTLGRNATGYCFVSGFGHKKVMNIHHRPSGADGIEEPVPGFLAGGPNLAVLTDCDPDVVRSPYPAKSFVDLECSYSTNEIAINWNAPLVYLAGGIDALLSE